MLICIGLALAVAFLIRNAILMGRAPDLFNEPWTVGPDEPCWTEEVGRGGGLSYGRGQCVNDALLQMDQRTARGDFPVPRPD